MLSICEFDGELLTQEVADFVRHDYSAVKRKAQCQSICAYLEALQTNGTVERLSPQNTPVITMVVEGEYIDRDFMEDYASYHSRSFYPYSRLCRRIHFFCADFEEKLFLQFLSNQDDELLPQLVSSENYLGFIIVKPLPKTYVGRVCLRYFPVDQDAQREEICGRSYKVNLFGIPLVVSPSIAFQEQDKVVAACATTALWSSFHANTEVSNGSLPSPSKITQVAVKGFPTRDRMFPNGGLDVNMMGHAIKGIGLEPYNVSLQPWGPEAMSLLKHSVAGYLKMGLGPAVLGSSVFEDGKRVGSHATTVVGIKYAYKAQSDVEETGPKEDADSSDENAVFEADNISALIVHDDNYGPYLQLELPESSSKEPSLLKYALKQGQKYPTFGRQYRPEFLLHNVYHKIRITIGDVGRWLSLYSILIEDYRGRILKQVEKLQKSGEAEEKSLAQELSKYIFWQNGPQKAGEPVFSWTVYLSTVSSLKEQLRQEFAHCKPAGDSTPYDILLEHWPKYIWRAKGSIGEVPVLDFLFDATDLSQGRVLLRLIPYKDVVDRFHRALCNSYLRKASSILDESVLSVLDSLNQYLTEEYEKTFSIKHLYGRALIPSYLRPGDRSKETGQVAKIAGKAMTRFGIKPSFAEFELLMLKKPIVLLWVVDTAGSLIVGIERVEGQETSSEEFQGHPCLVGAARGRIAGEIRLEEKEDEKPKRWVVNMASGRFVRTKPPHTRDQFQNAVERIEVVLRKVTPEMPIWRKFGDPKEAPEELVYEPEAP